MKKNYSGIEIAAVSVAAIILAYLLFVRPVVGVADNGDFSRIMGSSGLTYLTDNYNDKYFNYLTREYGIEQTGLFDGGYFSTEIVLVRAARIINNLLLPKTGTFDIRFLALVYSMIFLISIFLILKYIDYGSRLWAFVTAAAAIMIFTDIGYLSYFNSLYGEAVSYISLLLMIGCIFYICSRSRPSVYSLLFLIISAVFLTGAKTQNAPIGIVLIIFFISLYRLRKDTPWKSMIALGCTLILLTSYAAYASVPNEIKVCNKYQTVFYGILKGSKTPSDDLKKLGIKQDLSVLAGTNYFMKEYPIDIKSPYVQKEISEKVNPLKVAMYYVKNPGRFIEKLDIAAQNGFRLVQGFGNYEKTNSDGVRKTVSSFNVWSSFKENVLPHSLIFIAALYVLFFSVLLVKHKKARYVSQKIRTETFMLVGIIGVMQFVIPIIGDGEADLSKHLFLFNVCFDIMFLYTGVFMLKTFAMLVTKIIKPLQLKAAR